jgi:hypothetical protein
MCDNVEISVRALVLLYLIYNLLELMQGSYIQQFVCFMSSIGLTICIDCDKEVTLHAILNCTSASLAFQLSTKSLNFFHVASFHAV